MPIRTNRVIPQSSCLTTAMVVFLLLLGSTAAEAYERDGSETGSLSIRVCDADGETLPCRVHLFDSNNNPVRPPDSIFFRDHFVIDGEETVELMAGEYRLEVERGHEYKAHSEQVEINVGETTERAVTLKRLIDMTQFDFYSGDLHIHRPVAHVPLLMKADDLHVGPTITWWNANNSWGEQNLPEETLQRVGDARRLDVMAGEDEREGGALLFFHLDRPLSIQDAEREYPSPMQFVRQAHESNPDVWIDIEKPFWWDVPVWVASGQADSIGIANNHMCRRSVLGNEAWGRPRDLNQFPGPHGNGLWTQYIYYQILNTGMRLPPSAGSASGVLPNPVGFNRVYVHLPDGFGYDAWWEGLAAGRSFVTNGPLMLVKASGELPGHVFRDAERDSIHIKVEAKLISNPELASLEVIHNGDVVHRVELSDKHQSELEFDLELQNSGWFLIRVMANNRETFRFASTAPYYVELGDSPRYVSRSAIQFFVDWIDERMERIPNKLSGEDKLNRVLLEHANAKERWLVLLENATDE